MSDTDKKTDEEKGDEVLRRMLRMPPKPNLKDSETESAQKRKPDDTSVKKRRPEDH